MFTHIILSERDEMDKGRILKIIDCIEQAERLWGMEEKPSTSIHIDISNGGGITVWIYEDIPDGKCTWYANKNGWQPEGYIIDPGFVKAEEHIRRLLEERKETT